jgi:hypothetical protein
MPESFKKPMVLTPLLAVVIVPPISIGPFTDKKHCH